eukprot:scaffold10265_cov58-Phaeocystis_antarctica.AAC.3
MAHDRTRAGGRGDLQQGAQTCALPLRSLFHQYPDWAKPRRAAVYVIQPKSQLLDSYWVATCMTGNWGGSPRDHPSKVLPKAMPGLAPSWRGGNQPTLPIS